MRACRKAWDRSPTARARISSARITASSWRATACSARPVGAGNIGDVHALAVAHRLDFGDAQGARRMEIEAPRPAGVIVDRYPEMAMHRMIGARRHDGIARHDPGRNTPVEIAALRLASRADHPVHGHFWVPI